MNVPNVLAPVLEQRTKELKYRTDSAYFLSLMVFDLYARRPHFLTSSLHNELDETRDQFFQEIARDFNEAGKHPSWFEHRIEELVRERISMMVASGELIRTEKTKRQKP